MYGYLKKTKKKFILSYNFIYVIFSPCVQHYTMHTDNVTNVNSSLQEEEEGSAIVDVYAHKQLQHNFVL